ncbi:ammonium transporter [Caulobacter segnis]|uniref:ammonium transporter n=1 Tax=Caulobacter segnis TaxID=88688 RepID=UPI002410AF49|nr:ammonium transporter [Caulobacter segnis]MDG2522464.1 ammonium transporter [Caulobacter segnis]
MKLGFKSLAGVALAATAAGALAAFPALAQDAAAPVPDKGDTAWMLVSTVLVLLMILPGLALFYGGLVRAKNMLSVMMQVSVVSAIGIVAWVFWGYSLAFTDGGSLDTFVGGFGRLFLKDVTPASNVATFSTGVVIPELVFLSFQSTFAAITAALVVGSLVERMKFAAIVAFAVLWPILSYYPMAHMVWWWPGPDAIASAPDAAVKAGLIWSFGALDFAGGTVVHINAGIAALVGAMILGKRTGYGKEPMPPHSLTLTLVGAGLLWVGWFGFNAGSNLESNGYAALAMINTFVATAAAGLSWIITEWITRGKPSALGLASGVVAGLVAVTPAAGFAGPMGAVILGLIVSPICVIFCSVVKNALKYDDSLDAFGIHGVGGIVGAIATGILVSPALGGAGVVDYTSCAADGDISTCDAATYDMVTQVIAQLKGVGVTIVWSAIASAIVFFLIKFTIGLRAAPETEEEGLDIAEHGERAYHS